MPPTTQPMSPLPQPTDLPALARERISRPLHRGAFDESDAVERGLALVTVRKSPVTLYLLFDPDQMVLYEGRFFSYGHPITVALLDLWLDLAEGRTVPEIRSIGEPDVLALLSLPEGEGTDTPALGEHTKVLVPLAAVIAELLPEAVALSKVRDAAARQASGIAAIEGLRERSDAFRRLPKGEQTRRVEEVLDRAVRPALASDGGGLTLLEVRDGRDIVVHYQGNCGSCGIASGATAVMIEKTLRRHLHDGIRIVPVSEASENLEASAR